MCGELVDVLKTKLAEFPGRNTVLYPETSGNIRSGLRRWFLKSSCCVSSFGGIPWFVSLKKHRLGFSPGLEDANGVYIIISSFSVRSCLALA